MPVGWYFSQVTGNGQTGNPYRVALTNTAGLSVASIVPSTEIGLPLWTWALGYASGTNTQLSNANGSAMNEKLPVVALDAANGLNGTARTVLTTSLLTKFGITQTVLATTTLREVVELVGRKLTNDPKWTAEQMRAG